MNNFYGSFILVLHCHIPYVLFHDRMDEEWLFEAIAETYIPLLNVFRRLVNEGVSPKVTLTISPVLADQLIHPEFKKRFKDYCFTKIDYAIKDQQDFRTRDLHIQWLAKMWEEFYAKTLRCFTHRYYEDIIGTLKWLQDSNHIELMTCASTHPYLPGLCEDTTIQAQVKMAIKNHSRLFGRAPNGMWLPECGYRPSYWWKPPLTSKYNDPPYPRKGIEEFLSENDIEYTVIDNNQLIKAHPHDLNKSPLDTYFLGGAQIPKKPVTIFTRDNELSLKVWRHEIGYPGDGVYLDFHKKHEGGKLRYWKTTDQKLDLAYKHHYYPDDAFGYKVKEHAGHYKWLIAQNLKTNFYNTGRATLVATAFDAELFGHWWFEGPMFLYYVLKWISQDPEINTATCGEYMHRAPAYNYVYLTESSWGNHFDNSSWLNRDNEWVWEKIYWAEREMQYLAKEFSNRKNDQTLMRIIKQAIREFMIFQASDWQFMITNWVTRDHAERRIREHASDFERLIKMAWDYGYGRWVNESEWQFLGWCEQGESLFPDPELDWFRSLDYPPRC